MPSHSSGRRVIIIFWTMMAVFVGVVVLVIIAAPYVEDSINRSLIEDYRKNLGPGFSTDPSAFTRPATSQASQSFDSESSEQVHAAHEDTHGSN